jgi:uncharacterized protein
MTFVEGFRTRQGETPTAMTTETPPRANWKRLGAFFAAAMVLTHALMVLYLASGGSTDTPSASGFGAVVMRACPGIVALVFQRFVVREPVRTSLGISFRPNRWFVAAWLVPAIWTLLALGFALLVPGTHYTPDLSGMRDHFPGTTVAEVDAMRTQISAIPLPTLGALILGASILGPTISSLGAFGEEVAWRGYVLRELRELSFWQATFIAAVMQGIWHVPFVFEGFYHPGHPVLGTLAVLVEITLQSIAITYVCVRAQSVIAATIVHGTAGAFGVLVALFGGPSAWVQWVFSLTSIAALVVVIVLLVLHDRFVAEQSILRGPRAQRLAEAFW